MDEEKILDVKGGESNCCGASMYGDVCSDCKEHCEDISVDTDQVLDVVEKPLIDNLATITGVKLSDMLGKEEPKEDTGWCSGDLEQDQRSWDEHKDECNGCALCEL